MNKSESCVIWNIKIKFLKQSVPVEYCLTNFMQNL
jgi:hypothetical protein